MPEPKILEFAPYRLDAANETLVVDGEELALRPKAFALLWHLASNPDVLLTKEDLLDSVWPGRVVTEGGLSELVRELRKVLGDNARQPRYIATIHGRGYRFIAQVSETVAASVENDAVEPLLEPVGRRRELDQLLARYRTATKGKRQIVFLSGEPGIGKTTVVNAFCRRLRDYNDTHGQPLQIARGQCIEQYGAGEAYLPVLEALEQLAQSDADRLAVNALRQHAPTWLRQFPALLDAAEFEEIDRRASGATRERMLREAVNAVEQICRDTTLLLVLEDLHWSDYSTLDFVSYLAQRANEARLMLIATFRPIEVYAQAHPLKNVVTELKARGQCSELSLDCLDQRAVEDYVTARFSGRENAPKLNELAAAVHHRTDGHPLFMINVADYIEGLDFAGVPDSILASTPDTVRDLIAKQFARLSNDERHVLEAASVAGVEFSAASVAAAVDQASLDDIEGFCSSLAERKSFLVEHGESRWPDGIISTRYAFIHALYQNVIYFALPVGRRARLHERIARREENAWGERSQEIAAELAAHFEAARTIKAAVDYYTLAGDKAVRGWADREAIDLFTRALDLLRSEHDTPDRRERELGLLIALGVPLIHVRGYAAEDVGRVYARARELQHDVGESAQILPVLWGLWLYFVVRGEHHTAFDVANQLRDAERIESERFPVAHYAWGCSAFWRGSTVDACASFLRVVDFYSPESDVPRINLYSQDPKVVSLLYHGWALWIRGYPDQALASCEEALVWADELRHPFTRVFALTFFAVLRFLRGESRHSMELATAATAVCEDYGFEFFNSWATMLKGHAIAADGNTELGISVLIDGLDAHEQAGARMATTLWQTMLADACLRGRKLTMAGDALEAANSFMHETGEIVFGPEIIRLKGELLLLQSGGDNRAEAIRCFEVASRDARRQGARSWELRAALSLARALDSQGQRTAAYEYLSTVRHSIDEGKTTSNLREADTFLRRLSVRD